MIDTFNSSMHHFPPSHSNTISVLGISHNTAPVEVRERLSFGNKSLSEILPDCKQELRVEELAIFSTCNRTEIYTVSNDTPPVYEWFSHYQSFPLHELRRLSYFEQEREAIRHLFRVASGLDSLILGEPQILGQIKDAYQIAKDAKTLGPTLDRFFQQSFAIAKQIRSNTAIGEHPVSVAYAGAKLSEQFFDDHRQRTALIIGAGETGRLTADYLHELGIGRLLIANRTLERAQILAADFGGFAIPLGQIPQHLHEVDMVFAAISGNAILDQSTVRQAQKQRHHALQLYVDLSVPRVIPSDIDHIESVFLYSVDDLGDIIQHNREERRKAADEAEVMVNLYADDFFGWLESKPQQQLVCRIREKAKQECQELLEEAYRQLDKGDDPKEILDQFAYKLSKKLLHGPSELINVIPADHKDWLAIIASTFKVQQP